MLQESNVETAGYVTVRFGGTSPCFDSYHLYLYLYLNWQNVLGTHHASAHGGSSDLIVKMLD